VTVLSVLSSAWTSFLAHRLHGDFGVGAGRWASSTAVSEQHAPEKLDTDDLHSVDPLKTPDFSNIAWWSAQLTIVFSTSINLLDEAIPGCGQMWQGSAQHRFESSDWTREHLKLNLVNEFSESCNEAQLITFPS